MEFGLRLKGAAVDWHRFTPADIEYDFERDKLARHGVTLHEAAECFFSDFQIRRDKKYRDRYQLLGRTLGGRRLKIIFQLKPDNVVRIITGWPIRRSEKPCVPDGNQLKTKSTNLSLHMLMMIQPGENPLSSGGQNQSCCPSLPA
jgi:uncharacterized DUF497 family protein